MIKKLILAITTILAVMGSYKHPTTVDPTQEVVETDVIDEVVEVKATEENKQETTVEDNEPKKSEEQVETNDVKTSDSNESKTNTSVDSKPTIQQSTPSNSSNNTTSKPSISTPSNDSSSNQSETSTNKPAVLQPEKPKEETKPVEVVPEQPKNYHIGNCGTLYSTESEAYAAAEKKFDDFSDPSRYVSSYLVYSTYDKWSIDYYYTYW